jgi:diaminopropionate ammonia-lyase
MIADGTIAPGTTIVCASEGNHGRAVARAARMAGCPSRVYMARSVAPARVMAIEGEGATVVQLTDTYDDAVHQMAEDARTHGWTIVSDTAWPGYEDIPRRIMVGYTRLVDEIQAAWPHETPPDVVLVPGGVGGILGAVASACRWTWGEHPGVVCVEPVRAACLLASARAGAPTRIDGPLDTMMAGLRCGEVSTIGFEAAYGIVESWVAIDDRWAMDAMRRLARPASGDPAIRANASGAATLGGLLAIIDDPALGAVKARLGLGPASRVLFFVTEGVTDPAAFAQVLSPA